MNKSTYFTGQPTFSQLVKFIPKGIISKAVFNHKSDHYYKKFNTWHHLTTMLFACFGQCTSLREVASGMRALEGKLLSSGVHYFPARSTFSEANARRSSKVFEDIYFSLKKHWESFLSDSSKTKDKLYLIDSTVITLFQEIYKGSGSSYADGRRKGGLKIHVALGDHSPCPQIVNITDGASQDTSFLPHISLPAGSTVIMDRGYRNYKQYNNLTERKIRWVTRLRDCSYWIPIASNLISKQQRELGILTDEEVKLGFPQKKTANVSCRVIHYIDKTSNRTFRFVTNDFDSEPFVIAQLYKRRWAVELLFKRLKQNMPLKYFLGDNKNAICIQIWCALIADLLINLVTKMLKRKWAFSNITSIIRLHLFNYLDLISFLNNPEKARIKIEPRQNQLKIYFSESPPFSNT